MSSSPPKACGDAIEPCGIPNPFVGSPPFADKVYTCCIDQLSGTPANDKRSDLRIQSSPSTEAKATQQALSPTDSPTQGIEHIFTSAKTSPHRNLTNIFVANFPAHWGKSDLVDLFEGIPIASVNFTSPVLSLCLPQNANQEFFFSVLRASAHGFGRRGQWGDWFCQVSRIYRR